MTTGQALAHPTAPAPRLPPDNSSGVRLRLASPPTPRHPVDGAWWPHSTDATAQLPELVSAIDQRLKERTLRIGLHVDAWDNIPHRLAMPGRAVRVGWFRVMDPRLITVSLGGGKIITLRVTAPTAGPDGSRSEFAAATGSLIDQPSAPWEASEGDSWENEGGSSPSPGTTHVR